MNLEKLDLYRTMCHSTKDDVVQTAPMFGDVQLKGQLAFRNPDNWSHFDKEHNYVVLSYNTLVTLQNTINVLIEEQKQLWIQNQQLEQKVSENYNELSDALKYMAGSSDAYQEAKEDFEQLVQHKKPKT